MKFIVFLVTGLFLTFPCDSSENKAIEWTEFSAILKPSPIDGVGVFVTHNIPKGTRVFNPDLNYRIYKMSNLPPVLKKYCQFINEEEGLGPERFDRMEIDWYLNHSNTPNVMEIRENYWVAIEDIEAGNELLVDYNLFNEPEHLKEEYYKNKR